MSEKHALTLALSLLLLLPMAEPVTASEQTPIERLAGLSGEWLVLDAQGDPTDIRARYEVIAGGAAVTETLLAGMPDETVTMYHDEAGVVTLTQVSTRGRPQRLVPTSCEDPETLRFVAESESETAGRLLELNLTWIGEDRVRVGWMHSIEGSARDSRTFELRREVSVASLSQEVARMRVSLESLQRELDRRLKREITVTQKGQPDESLLELRTFATEPGWNVSGVPFRVRLHEQTKRFASTFAAQGDTGHTVANYPFKAGPGCRVRFSLLGGHGFVSVVEEKRAPPRNIRSIEDFAVELDAGEYGSTIERVVGGRWEGHPREVDWDLSRFEGKTLRLYVVDAVSNHYGQIAISEVSIFEDAPKEE